MKKVVFLQDIDLKASPSVRNDLRTDVVDDYAEILRSDKNAMPLIDLVTEDGRVFLLADGLHRLNAHMKLKTKAIAANVSKGSYEDALKIALQSNNRHGLRRTHADKRQCVTSALKQWTTLSDHNIAAMCGVDKNTVKAVRESLEDKGDVKPAPVRTGRDGRAMKVREKKEAKEEPKAKAEPKAPKEGDDSVKDALGRVMPVSCVQYWERIPEVKELIEHLSIVSKKLRFAQRDEDTMYAEVNISGALADLDKAWTNIQTAMPFAVCTQCQGHPKTQSGGVCRLCKNRGLISKFRFDTLVPTEVRNMIIKGKS